MLDLVAERARERGWEEGQVRLLISYGNRDLQEARSFWCLRSSRYYPPEVQCANFA